MHRNYQWKALEKLMHPSAPSVQPVESATRFSVRVSNRIICMTVGETLSETRFFTRVSPTSHSLHPIFSFTSQTLFTISSRPHCTLTITLINPPPPPPLILRFSDSRFSPNLINDMTCPFSTKNL